VIKIELREFESRIEWAVVVDGHPVVGGWVAPGEWQEAFEQANEARRAEEAR
jgi:hypothetical protein